MDRIADFQPSLKAKPAVGQHFECDIGRHHLGDGSGQKAAVCLARVEQLFPGAGDSARAEFWSGLRPATPSNYPYLGPTRFRNLYLNTGHGTLGWTLACGSGRVLADLMAGRPPEVGLSPSL